MPKDHEPRRESVQVTETGSTLAQKLDMHRARRLRSGQSWSTYWGVSPIEALAKMPRIKHVGAMTEDERSNLYRKLAQQF